MKMKKWIPILAGVGLAPVAAAGVKTLLEKKKTSEYTPVGGEERAMKYARKLSEMIRCETVSYPGIEQREKFLAFHKVLEELFPLLHKTLEKTEIDGNLFYYWKGKKSDRPVVLMSHQDVVPAEGKWEHEPFAGDIADGKVWGRGAGDIKCGVMAFMQAVEELIEEGYTPEEDVYLVSSATEEIGGDGGPKLVKEFERRGVRPWLLCDEGGGIISEPIGGIKGSFAMIGVVEKGIANVKFIARSDGGHASSPPRKSPIARLAAFENEIEKRDPFKRKLMPAAADMFKTLSGYADFGMRFFLGNLGLFRPVFKLAAPVISPEAAAMTRTTIAFTMQSGSEASNVLPEEASVSANLRFIPHQGMEESLALLRKIAAKYGLEMEVLSASDYCPPVDTQGSGWKHVTSAIEKTFPGLAYSPYVMTGATDARFYTDLCENCIRFAPVVYGREQMKGMHGLNENIEVSCLPGAVDYYKTIITTNYGAC